MFLDCPLDLLDMSQALKLCLSWCRTPGKPRTVITVNAALLTMMKDDPELHRVCTSGDLVLADGMPVVWGAKLAGGPVPARVAGVDLMARLLEKGSELRLSVYLLGAREEVVAELVQLCGTRYPGLTVAGHRNGYFGDDESPEVISRIRESGAHMLFVGMPSPFKEVWCHQHRDDFSVPLIMGVGGSFDVLAGFVSRAPAWMQTIGMEWFWRLLMEPRKMWKRYLVGNSRFLWMTAGWVLRRRVTPPGTSSR
jgi:N-acetylglucosaminyldiphosphoundecaprenol N-acetyl-beta-D-mannosaminyltransferase